MDYRTKYAVSMWKYHSIDHTTDYFQLFQLFNLLVAKSWSYTKVILSWEEQIRAIFDGLFVYRFSSKRLWTTTFVEPKYTLFPQVWNKTPVWDPFAQKKNYSKRSNHAERYIGFATQWRIFFFCNAFSSLPLRTIRALPSEISSFSWEM